MVRPSLDWETKIDKYQYTVSVGLGTNLFNWRDVTLSSGNNFALALYTMLASQESRTNTANATYVGVPKNNLPEGSLLMMKVRGVNNQGIISGTSMSYPVVYDTSPPVNPSISTSQNGNTMNIDFNNLHDPESGIIKVEYRVYDSSLSNFFDKEVVPWSDLVSLGSIRRYSFDASASVDISGRNYYDLQVYVRVTNANGMQTTISYKPVLMISPTQTNTYNYNFNFNF